jgi:hypothetical protein
MEIGEIGNGAIPIADGFLDMEKAENFTYEKIDL